MRLAVAQVYISEDPSTNCHKVTNIIEEVSRRRVNLIAFPEMNLTGFDARTLSRPDLEDELNRAVTEIGRLVRKLEVGVIVGRPLVEQGKVFNAATVLLPDGQVHNYRKMNLTEEEARFFTPGEGPLTFSWCGHCFGVIICRDQNFPELAKAVREAGAEALFIMSAHYYSPPEARWKVDKNRSLPVARAVENHFYVLFANAVGAHIGRISLGNSLIADPEGAVVATADEATEVILTYDLP